MGRVHILKKILLALIMLVLFAPLIQSTFNLCDVKNLKGDFKTIIPTDFTPAYWWEGHFQDNEEKYLNSNFGFRNTLVRLNNQYNYSLFGKTKNAEALLGKDGYLFANDYVISYTGKNYIGKDKIVQTARLLQLVQNNFKKEGIIFLPVIAPNKARALPQYLPDTCYAGYGNYNAYITMFKKLGIEFIDFNSYFAANVANSKYPLFSKYGVHWSSYGHFLAADSVVRYLNTVKGLTTPVMQWRNNIVLSDSLRDLDYDIAESINLLGNQMPSSKMAYPKATFTNTNMPKPSLLVIGDSYNFGFELTDMQHQLFSNYKFWYYFKEQRPFNGDPDAFYGVDVKEEVNNYKVILLLATEHNMVNYGFGFLEYMNDVYNGNEKNSQLEYDKRVKQFEKAIRGDAKWLGKIESDAITKHLNFDSLITENAIYMVNQERGK